MNKSSTSTFNSERSSESEERPQGFRKAQLIKQGKYHCYYECGHYFDSEQEAKTHYDCAMRKKCNDKLAEMVEGLPPEYLCEPLRSWTEEEVKMFKSFLKKVPKMGKNELIQNFIRRMD